MLNYGEFDPDAIVGTPADVADIARVVRSTPGGLSEGEATLLRDLAGPLSQPLEERGDAIRRHFIANKDALMGLLYKLLCLVTAPAQQLMVLELFSATVLEESSLPTQPTLKILMRALIDCLPPQPDAALEPFRRFLVDPQIKADVLSHALSLLAAVHVARRDPPGAAKLVTDRIIAAMAPERSVAYHAAGVRAAAFLLEAMPYRRVFVDQGGIPPLVALMVRHPTRVQLTYHATVCVWLLSFVPACQKVLLDALAIRRVHDVLRTYKKDKCARAALRVLKNFVDTAQRADADRIAGVDPWLLSPTEAARRPSERHMVPTGALNEMIQIGLPRTLQTLMKRQFGDEETPPLVKELFEVLERLVEDVSSYAEYRQEVLSGRLEWSPVHSSEKFWKENTARFEEEDFKVLRELALLLRETSEATTQEIALHDFGEFVKVHPHGRRIVSTILNIKTRIMELMSSPDKKVSKAALATTQKILVQKWEFLQ